MGIRLGQRRQQGALVDRKRIVSNGIHFFGISRLTVSEAEVLEGSIEGKCLVITCTLSLEKDEIPTHALINCRGTGIVFMDQNFAHHHQIPIQEPKKKRLVEVIDERPIESGDITHIVKVGLKIQDHGEQLPMLI